MMPAGIAPKLFSTKFSREFVLSTETSKSRNENLLFDGF